MSTETPTREYNKDTLKDTKLKSEALKELGEKQDDGKKLIDTDFGKKQLADKWMEKAGMWEDWKKAIYSFLDNYWNKTIIGNHENFVKAVKDFQSKNWLTADGVLGWKTLEAIDNSLTANKLDPKDNSKSRLADIESASRASKPAEGGIAKATASSLLSMSADLPNNDLALKEHTSLWELKNPLTPWTETAAKKNETLDPDDTKNLVYQDGKLLPKDRTTKLL